MKKLNDSIATKESVEDLKQDFMDGTQICIRGYEHDWQAEFEDHMDTIVWVHQCSRAIENWFLENDVDDDDVDQISQLINDFENYGLLANDSQSELLKVCGETLKIDRDLQLILMNTLLVLQSKFNNPADVLANFIGALVYLEDNCKYMTHLYD